MAYVVRHGKRIEVETVEATTAQQARRKRAQAKETFARIPHERGMRLYGRIGGAAWVVLLELDRLIFKSYGKNPVRLSNYGLAGMSRNAKWKALRQLEAAGVVTVERQGFESPLVTHHWRPIKPRRCC